MSHTASSDICFICYNKCCRYALLLSSTADGNLYGKTGTGNINGENISGWFIGYVETSDNTYFFALNIGATENATGSKASDIALSILSDMNIWY